jgi:hypothetical protein
MMTDEVRAVLVQARQRIEAGWVRLTPKADKGTYCLLTAITAGHTLYDVIAGPAFMASNLMRRQLGTRGIMTWNDTPGRTKDEVLAAIDAVLAND